MKHEQTPEQKKNLQRYGIKVDRARKYHNIKKEDPNAFIKPINIKFQQN